MIFVQDYKGGGRIIFVQDYKGSGRIIFVQDYKELFWRELVFFVGIYNSFKCYVMSCHINPMYTL